MRREIEEPMNVLTHLIGVILAIAALILLVVLGAIRGTTWHVVSFSLFGSGLILVYLTSTIYHSIPGISKFKATFAKLDQSMIYILIAATYTPICLITLRGALGWSALGVIWVLAISGIVFRLVVREISGRIRTASYIFMGWLSLAILVPLFKTLSVAGVGWLFLGGVLYTVGALLLGLERVFPKKTRWFGMHEVFHIFVVLGSFSHFWLMYKYVL
jgi:hemolysin III